MTFEHLDDPDGFVPDDEFRSAAVRDGRHRRTRRRLALTGGAVSSCLALLVVVVGGYGLWRTTQIDRVAVEFASPPVDLGAPFNVLVIGSDRRTDPAESSGERADTMMVVRVEPRERRLVLLSLPRDLVIDADPAVSYVRLNTELATGGPAGLVHAVESQLGIPLSAYVEVGFDGLVRLVDDVGGLPLSVSTGIRDEATGLSLDATSCASVDGQTALALLRSRHLEYRGEDGRWVADPSSDLGRMARQRAVLASLLPRVGEVADSLGGIDTALSVVDDHVTVDARLGVRTMLELARWAAEGPPPVLEEVSLPLGAATIQGASVLVLASGADQAVARVGGSFPGDIPELGGLPGPDEPFTSILAGTPAVPIGPCG